jgi:DNA-binding NtrC family response regulator
VGGDQKHTVTETAFTLPEPASARPKVPGVVMAHQRGPCELTPFRVDPPRTFGRVGEGDVPIDDAGISRRHASMELVAGGVRVTDLGSRNGTFVNGVRVPETGTFAPFGAVVRLSKTLFVVVEDVAPFERPLADPYPTLVGGPSLDAVRTAVLKIASATSPILLEGETGTGKEVVASIVHEASGRRGRFIAVNCAALGKDVVESELFGHARGAFSGATGARPGLFRAADGGTILLDEIGELDLSLQPKLLRALETGEVRGVGEDVASHVDIRLIAATNRDLADMAEEGEFRSDLFHRIAGKRIWLPPLRERREDIPRLSRFLLRDETMQLSAFALEQLMLRSWPGNVRELRHSLMIALANARAERAEQINVEHLEEDVPKEAEDPLRERITDALTLAEGNVTHAARELGMARSALYETIKRLAINPASFRPKRQD